MSRNSVKGTYDVLKAHHKAYVRRKYSKYQGMKIVGDKHLRNFVDRHLYDDQSPKAIAGRLKRRERKLRKVSKDSIYRYIHSIYGRAIESFRKNRKRKKRTTRRKRSHLADRTFIDKRPQYIAKRMRVGDGEADFVESGKSGKGILLVVVDRKTRASFLEQIITVTIAHVHKAFLKIKKRFPELKTITTDNDILLRKHKELERLLRIKVYFCNPYHSWEKGTVENTNKYIRRDIPKGSSIASYPGVFIQKLEQKLNRRIMECLKYRTPAEALKEVKKKKRIASRRAPRFKQSVRIQMRI